MKYEKKEIDTSKLEVGMVFKNKKELCEHLGIEYSRNGNTLRSIINNLERYFAWKTIGYKCKIVDIYDTPLPDNDKRKYGNNSIYVKCIELILCKYLSQREGGRECITKKRWWEILGMVNNKYMNIAKEELKKIDPCITNYEINNFYYRSNSKLSTILESALTNLDRRKLIKYAKKYVIIENEDHRVVDNTEEIQNILKAEYYVLHELFGYETINQVAASFRFTEYYTEVNRYLYEKYGWNGCYSVIDIIYNNDDMNKSLARLESDMNEALMQLNGKVITYLNKNAKDLYDKNQQEAYVIYELSDDEELNILLNTQSTGEIGFIDQDKFQYPDCYVEAQRILADELISIK